MSARFLIASLLAATAAATSPAVMAQSEGDGFYVGAHGAFVFLQNGRASVRDPNGGGNGVPTYTDFTVEHDDDIGFGVSVGYAFPSFRAELEVQQYSNPIPEPSATNIESDEAKALLAHINAWYPLGTIWELQPFVGGGFGYADHDYSGGTDSGISMQLGVGADWPIFDRFTLTAIYRFFDTESVEFRRSGGRDFTTGYQGMALTLGVRYDLFAPAPPPEPEPEPVQVVEPLPACGDGQDNDGDGMVDYPADLGCSSKDDNDETDLTVCADGKDNDGDGLVDYPDDPGCTDADDDNEKDPCKTPAIGERVDLRGCGTGDTITLRGVNFELNKATLTADSTSILDNVAEELVAYPRITLEVGGHTDSTGSDSYNQNLSERRANSVRDYLVGKGVDAGRLTAVGYGEAQPVADNETSEGRAENRRVELKILTGDE